MADQIGADINLEAATNLAEDVSYKLRQTISVSVGTIIRNLICFDLTMIKVVKSYMVNCFKSKVP